MKDICLRIIESLQDGKMPRIAPEEIACFAPQALAGNALVTPDSLQDILRSLDERDIPTFERALAAIEAGEQAWIGFKIVADGTQALGTDDPNAKTPAEKTTGSASTQPLVFVATENKEITCARPFSARDRMQMLDITRGPGMHNSQYAGLDWLSVPLFEQGRVFILGAGNVSAGLERLAQMVGFDTIAVDYDAKYLNKERFPLSKRVLVSSFLDLDAYLDAGPADYLCVLSRGHMFDTECLLYALSCGAHYVGMMGCSNKNAQVIARVAQEGYSPEVLEGVHAPIGLSFDAKSSIEIAMSITAELVQERAARRKGGSNKPA